MKKSLSFRIATVFIVLTAFALIAIALINLVGADKYYSGKKQDILVSSYNLLNESSSKYRDPKFKHDCDVNNLTYAIADSNMGYIDSNTYDGEAIISQLFGTLIDMEEENINVIEKTDDYELAYFRDVQDDIEYLELMGILDNGWYYIVRYPMNSIREVAVISFKFYLLVGLSLIAACVVVIIIITKRITRPILELRDISQRMAKMDFTARYTSGGIDEIGQLGASFNTMQSQLEKTIQELQAANVQLEKDIEEKIHIDEMRQQFLSNVSHDLKTPIALIQGYAEGLKEMAQDEESRNYYCDIIMDEASKMNRLVRQLLSINQLEAGQNLVERTEFDLSELVTGVVSAVSSLNEDKGVFIQNEIKGPVNVYADQFMIEEVVTNYTTNAFNHVNEEKLIRLRVVEESDRYVLKLFNTGNKIPNDELEKIWSKFYKVDKARTREYGGSGIGLSIVKAIADLHGEKCWAENTENGVEFSFTFSKRTDICVAE